MKQFMAFLSGRFAATLATIMVAITLTACGGGGGEGSAFTQLTCPPGTSPTLAGTCLSNGMMTAQKAAITTAVPQSGIWWNPAESGRGYVVEVQGDTLAFGAYMYAPDGKPAWYTGALQRSADGSYSGQLIRFAGGQTISSAYQAPTQSAPIATALFQASSATSASLMLTVNGATSVIPIEKFVFGSGPSTASFQGGMWWNPSESGRGFVIEVQGDKVAMSSYMYDSVGDPVWYLTVGQLTTSNSFQGSMETYAGGQTLGGTYKAPVKTEGPGALRFEATSSTTATLTLPGGKSDPQVVKLERFYFGTKTLSWYTPPVKVSVTPMGQKVYSANMLPEGCTSSTQQCWRDAVANGTVKVIETSATRIGQDSRPIVFVYFRNTKTAFGVKGQWNYLPAYADDGTIAASDIYGGISSEIDWIYGNEKGVILHEKSTGLCYQYAWDPVQRSWSVNGTGVGTPIPCP